MIDHIAVQVADVEASAAFYLRVFGPIGLHEAMRYDSGNGLVVGLAGADDQPTFWLGPTQRADDRELHIAFQAADRASVDAVHAAAVEAGVEVLHTPREWPEYHPGYYGVFLRDPDGHNVEAVCHR